MRKDDDNIKLTPARDMNVGDHFWANRKFNHVDHITTYADGTVVIRTGTGVIIYASETLLQRVA